MILKNYTNHFDSNSITSKYIILILTSLLLLFTSNTYLKSQQLKPIDRDSNYIGRIYIYLDMNSCAAYVRNVNHVEKMTNKYNLERVVFLQQEAPSDVDSIRSKHKWQSKCIADEYQIFKEYYAFRTVPGFLLLNSEGKEILNSRLDGAHIKFPELKSILDSLSKNVKNSNPLKVLSKVKVIRNGKSKRSGFHKFGTYDYKNNITYMRFNGSYSLWKIDSTGIAEVMTSKKSHPILDIKRKSYYGMYMNGSCDTIISLFKGEYYTKENKLFFYDIEENKYTYNTLDRTKISDTTFISNFYTYLDDKIFVSYDTWYNTKPDGNKDWKSFYVFDLNGKYVTSFGEPSGFFRENFLGRRYIDYIQSDGKHYYSLQRLQDSIRVWDKEYNLLKYIPIKMGKAYNEVLTKIEEEIAQCKTPEDYSKLNLHTAIIRHFVYDEISKTFLVSYDTEITNANKQLEENTYYTFFDINGNRLFDEDIKVRTFSKPYYFKNGIIMSAESNSKNEVEIVKYQIPEDKLK